MTDDFEQDGMPIVDGDAPEQPPEPDVEQADDSPKTDEVPIEEDQP